MNTMQVIGPIVLSLFVEAAVVSAGPPKAIEDHGQAMLRDAEEMVMHGGMGDGKAIVHHCGEVAKHAEAILKVLPAADEHGKAATPICRRPSRTAGGWPRWETRWTRAPV